MEENATMEKVDGEVVNEVVPAESKMEFRLINPTENGFLQKIGWNKEELMAAVRAKTAAYQNVVYTEDNMKQAKADRAELNNLVKQFEERRKKVKELVMAPYDAFKEELDEVTALIQEPILLIDTQVKEFENRQKEEKKEKLLEAYNEVIGDLAEVLPFEKVFDTRYLNKTYKLETAQTEIKEKVQRVCTDLQTIDGLDSKYKLNAKDVYIKTLDLSKALAENKRLADLEEKLEAEKKRKAQEEAERAEAERKRREEAEAKRAAEEERQRQAAEKRLTEQSVPKNEEIVSEKQESVPEMEESVPEQPQSEMGKVIDGIERQAFQAAVDPFAQKPAVEEKKFRIKFAAVGTRQQLADLTQYMKNHGIEFGQAK